MEPGGFDMQQIFAAAQQMQAQLANAQQALADSEVTGNAPPPPVIKAKPAAPAHTSHAPVR